MEQLNCTFYLDPTDELREYTGNMWSMDFPDLDAFFAAVETSAVFKLLVETYAPVGVQIVQGAV